MPVSIRKSRGYRLVGIRLPAQTRTRSQDFRILTHARWGDATPDELATGAAELRELAGGRGDLLAEAAGLALGTAQIKAPEYQARASAVAVMCRAAGADETLIPRWIEEGRTRAASAALPPFSGGLRQHP
jgi:hypothetical protein